MRSAREFKVPGSRFKVFENAKRSQPHESQISGFEGSDCRQIGGHRPPLQVFYETNPTQLETPNPKLETEVWNYQTNPLLPDGRLQDFTRKCPPALKTS